MKRFIFIPVLLLFSFSISYSQTGKKTFTIVLDAGHGGEDTGAIGHGNYEKTVNLEVVKQLGDKITKELKNVKVIYTRTTDVFIPLHERSHTANKNKADFFMSIHCNATTRQDPNGTEVWVLGADSKRLDKNELALIQAENDVIELEDDKTKYQDFDPSKPETMILIMLKQSIYQDKSLTYAKLLDDEFKKSNRFSRGVKQSGFHVLVNTATPAVLVELGFISNPTESQYISSPEGQKEIVDDLFVSLKKYIDDWKAKNNLVDVIDEKEKPVPGATYKTKLITSKTYYQANDPKFMGLKDIEIQQEGNLYTYYYGSTSMASEKTIHLDKAKKQGFNGAVIVEFKDDIKLLPGNYYCLELLNTNKKYSTSDAIFKGYKDITRVKIDKNFSYRYGKVYTWKEINKLLADAKKAGFKEAIISKQIE